MNTFKVVVNKEGVFETIYAKDQDDAFKWYAYYGILGYSVNVWLNNKIFIGRAKLW